MEFFNKNSNNNNNDNINHKGNNNSSELDVDNHEKYQLSYGGVRKVVKLINLPHR